MNKKKLHKGCDHAKGNKCELHNCLLSSTGKCENYKKEV